MSESSQPAPDNRIQDPALAEDIAYAEKPYHELASHAQDLGLNQVAKDLRTQADEASDQVQVTFGSAEARAIVEGRGGETQEPQERKFGAEQLRELMDSGFLAAHFIEPGTGFTNLFRTPQGNTDARQSRVAQEISSFPGVALYHDEFRTQEGSINLQEEYKKMDIPEVVTLAEPIDGKAGGRNHRWRYKTYGDAVPDSPHAEERNFLLSYATIRGDSPGAKFEHTCPPPDGRPGNYVYFRILLPESDARTLFTQMQEDPAIARDMMTEALHFQGMSDEYLQGKDILPPYEKWRENCGGVSRMAFRSAFDELPADSAVTEF